MFSCSYCQILQKENRLQTRFVTDGEINNPEYIRDVRNFCASLPVMPEAWIDYVNDLYRDYRGVIVDEDGNELLLNMAQFERDFIREWFRGFCSKVPTGVVPRVRPEARGRVKILITILKASYPLQVALWGVSAANDNDKLEEDRQHR